MLFRKFLIIWTSNQHLYPKYMDHHSTGLVLLWLWFRSSGNREYKTFPSDQTGQTPLLAIKNTTKDPFWAIIGIPTIARPLLKPGFFQ